jgi:hypothetical protein
VTNIKKKFNMGGKVWSPRFGNGSIVGDGRRVIATFKTKEEEDYTIDGRWAVTDLYPSLFHGHNLIVVGAPEKWIVIYGDGVVAPFVFTSEKEAKDWYTISGMKMHPLYYKLEEGR